MQLQVLLFSLISTYSIYIILACFSKNMLEMRNKKFDKFYWKDNNFIQIIFHTNIFVQYNTGCNFSLSVLLCTFIFYSEFFVCIYELCRSNCLLQFKVTTKIICRMGKLLFHWKEPWGEMEEKDNTWIYITQLCTFVFFH